ELIDRNNPESPLARTLVLTSNPPSIHNNEVVQHELKLLGDIFHSSLRDNVAAIISELNETMTPESKRRIQARVQNLLDAIQTFRVQYAQVAEACTNKDKNHLLKNHFKYVDEFISLNINDFLNGLLYKIRSQEISEFANIDRNLCQVI